MSVNFSCHLNGQIAGVTRDGCREEYLWDGLALIRRGVSDFINEPAVTGGNPVLSGDKVLFNDLLGNTLGVKDQSSYQPVTMTAFGESDNVDAFFTGKPYIGELGYAFLFRNYRPEQGKWQTADHLGYPDGWNSFAYVNNGVTMAIDWLGAATMDLRKRPVKNTFGLFDHTSMHMTVTSQEYDQLSPNQKSRFIPDGNGNYTVTVSGFEERNSSVPFDTYLGVRYNDPSDASANTTAIDSVTSPTDTTLDLIKKYLDEVENYRKNENQTDYD